MLKRLLIALAALLVPTIAFADCNGQFQSGNICGNPGGSQAPPKPSSISALLDVAFGSTQGSVLYRGSSLWQVLTPGSAGQVLSSGGPSANVSWSSVAGPQGANNSLQRNNGGSFGGISGATSDGTSVTFSTGDLKINDGSATAGIGTVAADGTVSSATLTSQLDAAFSSTQGSILYRSNTAWVALGPGSSGFFLQTQGAAANPTWAAASGGTGCVTGGSAHDLITADGASGCTTVTVSTLTNGALQLGLSGTPGSVTMGNGSSGLLTLQAVAGALGSVTASFPANTGIVAELNLPQTWTAVQTFTNSDFCLLGSSTGCTTFTSANSSASNFTATFPANNGTLAELNLAQTFSATQTFSGLLNFSGLSTGTIANCLGITSGHAVVLSATGCAGITTPGSTTSGDIVTWNNSSGSSIADAGLAFGVTTSYWYPYGLGNGGCFAGAVCTVPTGQTVPGGVGGYDGAAGNVVPQLWNVKRSVTYSSVPSIDISLNALGTQNGNSAIPGQGPLGGKVFSIKFTSSSIAGSPVTISYTASGGDSVASVAQKLCDNIIANTAVTNATTQMVCDSNQGGGGFNLQWSVVPNITTQSTGTGTINLTGPFNNTDGIFVYHVRAIPGYTFTAGDLILCDEYDTHQICGHVIEDRAGTGLADEYTLDVGGPSGLQRQLQISEGVVIPCPTFGTGPTYPGNGSLAICNAANGGSLWFGNNSSPEAPDARIFENSGGALVFEPGSAGNLSFFTAGGVSQTLDYAVTNGGAWTLSTPFFLTGLGAGGTGVSRLCVTAASRVVVGGC